jgi:hypothetical protein
VSADNHGAALMRSLRELMSILISSGAVVRKCEQYGRAIQKLDR